jgi:solute:Na+ symporter, SSS family
VMNGMSLMFEHADDHFHMVFNESNRNYLDLPGLSILIGGMWIVNLNYWGCNQYITQRALGADLPTARNGILFAAFLKLIMPIIVVLPGIAAYVLHREGMFQSEMMMGSEINPDRAYPVLLNLLPVGLKGLAFAALTAAIVASLAGKANSISTIFTLDLYKKYFNPAASEQQLVNVGKITIFVAMVLAMVIAPFMGIDKKGGFQYIQEYTGFVSPGIFAIFILGFFWKRTTSTAALVGAIIVFPLSLMLKFLPKWADLSSLGDYGFAVLNPESALFEIPFIDRMGIVFVIVAAVMIVISLADKNSKNNPKGLEIDAEMFKPKGAFAIGAALVVGILTALYIVFW